MMSTSAASILFRHQSFRAFTACSRRPRSSINPQLPGRCFSSAEAPADEKPLIPGIGKGKTSTGLVGLPVDHDAVPKMITKYQALLDKMAASDMPPTAQYRINVEKIARYRIQAAQENLDDPEKVEELCNCGQVEELVQQADDEMIVLDMYLKERWWELVKPVEIEFNPNPMEDHGDIEWGEDMGKGGEENKYGGGFIGGVRRS